MTNTCSKCNGRGQVRIMAKNTGNRRLWSQTLCDCAAAWALLKSDARIADAYQNSDGFWIEMATGWTADPRDAHDIREDSMSEALSRVANIVPCDCETGCAAHWKSKGQAVV